MKTDPRNVTRLLVDSSTPELLEAIPDVLSKTNIAGLDIETEDSLKHKGLLDVKGDPIDFQRSKLCGLSIYPNDADYAFYVNIGHADIEKRLPFDKLAPVLDSFTGHWVVHNLPFELAMLELTKGYKLRNGICSMQLCVSAYNEDEYARDKFHSADIGEMKNLMAKIDREFMDYDKEKGLTHRQGKLFGQICGKESRAEHSYNGFVKSISYGYGLKKAVKSWFGYDMVTFEEVLAGREHMGQLTGQEAALYGCDDAIWCMKLYDRVIEHLLKTNPAVVQTFFDQELPMCEIYADLKRDGLRIDLGAVKSRREEERHNFAAGLRKLKTAINEALPFPPVQNTKLADREEWYKKNWERYRERLISWSKQRDFEDDSYKQCIQVSSPVSNSWAKEKGQLKPTGLNLTHYMVTRTIFYDLLGLDIVMDKGKVQSDNEARQSMYEDLVNEKKEAEKVGLPIDKMVTKLQVLNCINELATIDQRMKLYLNPYIHLIDPETSRVYPTLSSMLNSRRMGTQYPNPMQLAKRGTSTYIRGFYLPDDDECVIMSLDWSQIELVLIGEFSGDPEFFKAYGQIPYEDLHLGAAADCLSVVVPGLNVDIYKTLKNMSDADAALHSELAYLFRSTSGEALTPGKAYKYWRTEVGKGANFNYWYSGALSTVGQRLRWTKDQMWEATERYRTRFQVAEEWRVRTIHEAQSRGYVELPDHHRRTRFEATPAWAEGWRLKMSKYADMDHIGIRNFTELMIRQTARRAGNQAVNSMIQGTSATLAKRSSRAIRAQAIKDGFYKFRFMLPIHDELVFNIHPREAWDFMMMAKKVMCDHPDIIKNLKPTCTASVGRTFEPYSKTVPFGQIEIDEAPGLPFVPAKERDGSMSRDTFDATMQYLRPQGA